MIRWAWRLFRREWRQQLLILLLIIVAVAAVVVGSAVAVNTPPPANAGFGTAHDLATFNLTPTQQVTRRTRWPTRRPRSPCSSSTSARYRSSPTRPSPSPGRRRPTSCGPRIPHGPFGGPMLQLLSGHYPTGPNEIALTPGLASELNLHVGDTWPQGGKTVVGIVQNPQSLLDEFALVAAGPGDAPDAGERPLRRAAVDGQGSCPRTSRRPGRPTTTSSTRRPSCWRWRRSACS